MTVRTCRRHGAVEPCDRCAPPRVVRNHDVLGAGSPRTCGFCGDRDPRWHGHDSQGWTRHLGLDRCPSCTFTDPPPLERERETQ
jgi:hypothetical protein